METGSRILAVVALLASARFVVRSAMPGSRPRRGLRPAEPVPISGAATGLLESIPFLEKAPRGRMRGTVRLMAWIGLLALLFALTAYGAGRAIALWLDGLKSL